jgi:hypothetical protein
MTSYRMAGTYTYPISIALPGNSPPTLHCPFGSVTYHLKAQVHRPGAFHPKLTAVREVEVISYPVADDAEEHDGLLVERQWEGQMAYVIGMSARMFCIGGTLPVQFTIMPLAKVKVYRVAVFLDGGSSFFLSTLHSLVACLC